MAKACDDARDLMESMPKSITRLDGLYPKIECPAIKDRATSVRKQLRRASAACGRK